MIKDRFQISQFKFQILILRKITSPKLLNTNNHWSTSRKW